jgi:hypothetical protein
MQHIQGDQKVSVHQMITAQAARLVSFNVRSVVGCAVTVVPEHLVRACLRDGTLTILSVTPATSSVTRASAVLSVGEPIAQPLKGRWFSVCAVASEFHRLSFVSLSVLGLCSLKQVMPFINPRTLYDL